jgi:hypothetical protein
MFEGYEPLARFRYHAIACAILLITSVAEAQPAAEALDRLRGLAGDWEGTLEWSGARTGSGTLTASYHLAAGKSAVIEDLMMGKDAAPSMMSVYHLDGNDLRMTHYCLAQNQPRLKATRIDEDGIFFSFVDATNLSVQPAHVEGVELRFIAADHLVIRFTFDAAGKKSVERIELKRRKT